ncbi:MAG: SDR family oxidoreductase [bacterium]
MSNKVVVITGASSGIGAVLAKKLGERGDKMVLAARREEALNEVAASCGSEALTVVTDVTRRVDVERLKEVALAKFGGIDVWINNVGRGITKPVLELSDDDFDQIIDVNLKSALYGMQAIIPYFQKQGKGHLINVSSFLSRVPLATLRSIYSASKAALNSLTANLRMDLQAQYPGIHVSLVMPGMVLTEFHENVLGSRPQTRPGNIANPQNAQTAEQVATAIAELIDHPRPEIYTNPAMAGIATKYIEDVAAFEATLFRSAK